MPPPAYVYVVMPCGICGAYFVGNVERVPSFIFPADDPDGLRRPLCRVCVGEFNEERRRIGLETVEVYADSYEPSDLGQV